jgi:hypothetical protein
LIIVPAEVLGLAASWHLKSFNNNDLSMIPYRLGVVDVHLRTSPSHVPSHNGLFLSILGAAIDSAGEKRPKSTNSHRRLRGRASCLQRSVETLIFRTNCARRLLIPDRRGFEIE